MTDLIETAPFNEIWEGDMLGRWRDAETIRRFSIRHLALRQKAGLSRTYVLNLDADWGSGKSFFLTRLKKHLRAKGHVAAYVNAWEDDHSDDPFLTVIDAIQKEFEEALPQSGSVREDVKQGLHNLGHSTFRVLGGAVASGAKYWLRKKIGDDTVSLLTEAFRREGEGVGDDETLEAEVIDHVVRNAVEAAGAEMAIKFKVQRDAQKNFKRQLEDLSKIVISNRENIAPIFVLIDELDRCRPSYAIELLERVKHIFSLRDFVFVLGTDTAQLAHTVRGVYGQDFDGPRYLKRFIDRTYRFQEVDKAKFVEYQLEKLGLDDTYFSLPEPYSVSQFISEVLVAGGRSLRDIEQIMEEVSTFVALWPSDISKIDLITLITLLYERQSDVGGSFLDGPFGRHTLKFRTFWKQESGIITVKKAALSAMQLPGEDPQEPRTSFQKWLSQKREHEFRAFRDIWGDVPRDLSVKDLYGGLLSQVTSIEGERDQEDHVEVIK